MSTQNVAQFLEQLAKDQELQAELSIENKTREERIAAAVALGAKKGFEFTATDCATFLETAKKVQDGELPDAELETVAGGAAQIVNLQATAISVFGDDDLGGISPIQGTAVAGVRG